MMEAELSELEPSNFYGSWRHKRFKQCEEQFYATLSVFWQQHQKGEQLTEEELSQFTQLAKDIGCCLLRDSE